MQVEFPFVLDMTGYTWNSDQAAVYDRQGVIVHVGESVKEVHYYAVVRDRDGNLMTKRSHG